MSLPSTPPVAYIPTSRTITPTTPVEAAAAHAVQIVDALAAGRITVNQSAVLLAVWKWSTWQGRPEVWIAREHLARITRLSLAEVKRILKAQLLAGYLVQRKETDRSKWPKAVHAHAPKYLPYYHVDYDALSRWAHTEPLILTHTPNSDDDSHANELAPTSSVTSFPGPGPYLPSSGGAPQARASESAPSPLPSLTSRDQEVIESHNRIAQKVKRIGKENRRRAAVAAAESTEDHTVKPVFIGTWKEKIKMSEIVGYISEDGGSSPSLSSGGAPQAAASGSDPFQNPTPTPDLSEMCDQSATPEMTTMSETTVTGRSDISTSPAENEQHKEIETTAPADAAPPPETNHNNVSV